MAENTSRSVMHGGDAAAFAEPAIQRIGTADLADALSRGWRDFLEVPTQLFFLCLIYPVMGLTLGFAASGNNLLPILWPLAAGFALVGPVAALGLYEMSRRREQGQPVGWRDGLRAYGSASIGSILAVGVVLLALFVAWIACALWIWRSTIGPAEIGSFTDLLAALRTPEGTRLILLGNLAGFLFAVVALAVSVVSFPLLLERDIGAGAAIRTSLRAVAANPGPMAAWGAIVAGLLFLGSLPLFVGLAVVMPVLGHATWHLYRKVVA
ncbi:DUF2189 domain-containing protein [Pararoseomonas sp. SCSIO 73927]|uniref:DUF2189 domain-containing protein n=1 Tax=Pararoseomonas sp. SCSIO 73927 TaxID=3114537 RepID=UPI0030CD099C